MAHLIQPLEIDGTTYCVDVNGLRTTQVVNTEILSAPTDLAIITDTKVAWEMTINGIASDFEVSFGVGCGDTVELYFEALRLYIPSGGVPDVWSVGITPYINGVAGTTLTLSSGGTGAGDMILDLSNVPCGNIITIVITMTAEYENSLKVIGEIVSVT